MPTLHLLNRAPNHSAFQDCLTALNQEDKVLLIGDGVYALFTVNKFPANTEVFVLRPDLVARGLSQKAENFNCKAALVDYAGFVHMTERCSPVVSWY